MLKIRRSRDRLIFNMGIPIPGKMLFILRRSPEVCYDTVVELYVMHNFLMHLQSAASTVHNMYTKSKTNGIEPRAMLTSV